MSEGLDRVFDTIESVFARPEERKAAFKALRDYADAMLKAELARSEAKRG